MKKLMFIYILLIACFVGYVYFSYFRVQAPGEWNPDSPGIKGSSDERYVMVTFQSGIDYWKSVLKGFEDAAGALGVTVEYRGATQYDVQEEINILEQEIAKKPAGIAVTAIQSEAITQTINKAVEDGIPVVLFDSGAPESLAYSTLATDNYHAGEVAAEKMAELIGGRGQVAVITSPKQLNHQQRTSGFTDKLRSDFTGIEVAAVVDGKGDAYTSEQAARALMEQHPELTGIFVTEFNGGLGVGNAVVRAGKQGQLKIIGFDTDKGTLDMIEAGVVSATLAQGTWNMGYWSLMHLFHLKHREGVERPVPPQVDTGITVVTKANVSRYYVK